MYLVNKYKILLITEYYNKIIISFKKYNFIIKNPLSLDKLI